MRLRTTNLKCFVLLILFLWAVVFVALHSRYVAVDTYPDSLLVGLDLLTRHFSDHANNSSTQSQQLWNQNLDIWKLQLRIQELEQELAHQKGPLSAKEGSNLPNPPFSSQNPVCQSLPQPIPNAASLWTYNLARIHKASQLPNDHRYDFHDFTAMLLHLISPRLPTSVKTVPRDNTWDKLDEILRVAHERYQYVQNPQQWESMQSTTNTNTTKPPRRVKILIMGGSLLVGMNCRKLLQELNLQMRLPISDCSWANRLEKVLNQFLWNKVLGRARPKLLEQFYIVEVHKIAMGGTNTATGTTILEYDLIPPEAKNPDIIINAYATNDMHIITMLDAQSGNATLRDKVFDMVQDFVRHVMEPTMHNDNCQASSTPSSPSPQPLPPIFVHLDDYLGNEQREIWATTELSQGVQVLANYYGFASASYADVVRDFVYGDTREYWFSPQGWYDNDNNSSMAREIHPNMGMHMIAAWIVAFNFLNMVTTFCSLEGFNLHSSNKMMQDRMGYNNTNLNNLPFLTGRRWPKGRPQPPPQGLPPPLTKTLSLDDVSKLWRDAKAKHKASQQSSAFVANEVLTPCDSAYPLVKCPFSWLSGISSAQAKPKQVETYFLEHTNLTGDWVFQADHGKLGIVPMAQRKPLDIELTPQKQTIRRVTIFYMKSYGLLWEGSKTSAEAWSRPTATSKWQLLHETVLVGSHDKKTSESYTELLDLSQRPVEAGAALRLRFKLEEGTTFKIMGLAMCS